MKTNLFIIALAATILAAAGASAADQRSSGGTIYQQSVSVQKVNPQTVSPSRVIGPRSNVSGTASLLQGTAADALFGEAGGQAVLPPTTQNTFDLKAEYFYPNPKSESHPFVTHTQSVRLPQANKGNVTWSPNQGSVIVNR